ncbi:hypothetical protein WJX81_001417 [Elliptochloris bilobata]|uniref:Histone deacetylase n=1 Tax=Elliptochloris bilobata TaxID=381761 RepID=A0AAW1RRG9_9CHLO
MGERKSKVAYFYDSKWKAAYYGSKHPMKPVRLDMAHHLILAYELHKDMDVYTPRKAAPSELAQFHAEDYVRFLERVSPNHADDLGVQMLQFGMGGMGTDCPVFEGLFDFCQRYAGASIEGATKLNHGLADIAINWAGGLHHAKKSEASGFCYVNDLVLGILELLKYHARVLYVDIDIHHGDGVEEAFYLTDRVMTVSFHKHGDYFFPGTGDLSDIGERAGRYYSINVPLDNGTDDATFHRLFKPIMEKVVQVFQPGAIVLQCGADSLANDRLGCFNLTLDGHAEAVKFMKRFGLPMLVTGGGGYTKNNVARCWTNETAALVGRAVPEELPPNTYLEYYAPDHRLNLHSRKVMDNGNARAELERIRRDVMENLRHLAHTPSVQMAEAVPDSYLPEYNIDDADENPDLRLGRYAREHLVVRDREHDFYDDDDVY